MPSLFDSVAACYGASQRPSSSGVRASEQITEGHGFKSHRGSEFSEFPVDSILISFYLINKVLFSKTRLLCSFA